MIQKHIESLDPRAEAPLDKTTDTSPGIGECLDRIDLIRKQLEHSKQIIHQHSFESVRQEILYHKQVVPDVYSQLIFYTKLARIEGARKYRSPGVFRDLLQEELRESEAFLHKNDDKCQYFYEDRTHLDDPLFTCQKHGLWSGDEIGAFIDGAFTVGAYWLAMIKAHEQWRDWVRTALDEMADAPTATQANRLPCMAKPVELVEIFKAMHLAGYFGDATFKEVMDWARDHLKVKIGNYDVILQELAMRKTSQTKALDRLTGVMVTWLDDKL